MTFAVKGPGYNGTSNYNTNVLVTTSADDGDTWSDPPIAVQPDESGTPTTEFNPWISVDRRSNSVNVLYLTTDGTGSSATVKTRLATSTGSNLSFTHQNLSERTSTTPGNGEPYDYLEYIGLAVRDGTVHGLWPAWTGSNPAVRQTYAASAAFLSSTNSNTLTIDGTGDDDIITIRRSSTNSSFLEVRAKHGVAAEKTEYAGLSTTVNKIVVNGLGGADTITIEEGLAQQVTVNGGNGDDIIIAKSSATIDGGSGADEVRFAGTSGNDTISASASQLIRGSLTLDITTIELAHLTTSAGTDALTVSGGTLDIVGTTAWGTDSTLSLTGGIVNLKANAGVPATASTIATANLTINVSGSGARLVLMADQDIKALTVSSGNSGLQSVDMNTPAGAGVYRSVRIYPADLQAAEYALFAALVSANGPNATQYDGIYDSGLAAHTSAKIGLTQTVDAKNNPVVFMRTTRIGDLNLDGAVTFSDWSDLGSHYGQSGSNVTWDWGDINYDNSVSISDWIDLGNNYNTVYA